MLRFPGTVGTTGGITIPFSTKTNEAKITKKDNLTMEYFKSDFAFYLNSYRYFVKKKQQKTKKSEAFMIALSRSHAPFCSTLLVV